MTANPQVEPAHSPIGASTCERWSACPGSVAAIAALPPQKPSIYAAEGTVAHTVAERYFAGITKDLSDDIGRTFVQDGFEIEVKDDMVEAVQEWVDLVDSLLSEYKLPRYFYRNEIKFKLLHLDPEAFGTCDGNINVPMNRIIVIDYKHGKGKLVEVKNNVQCLYYALGAYYELPETERRDLVWVETIIVQPRGRHPDGSIRRHVYRIEELLEFELALQRAIERVRRGDATLAAGTHCQFCNAKPVCSEFRRYINAQAQLDFGRFEAEAVHLPAPSSLSPERIATLMDNAEAIRGWCNAVDDLAHVLAEGGQVIPGYELVVGETKRRWSSETAVEDTWGDLLGDDLYTRKIKSPAQLEKTLKKHKGITLKQAESEIYDYWIKPDGKSQLQKIGSGKDLAKPKLANEFEAFIPPSHT